jgi:hypothetical protein
MIVEASQKWNMNLDLHPNSLAISPLSQQGLLLEIKGL